MRLHTTMLWVLIGFLLRTETQATSWESFDSMMTSHIPSLSSSSEIIETPIESQSMDQDSSEHYKPSTQISDFQDLSERLIEPTSTLFTSSKETVSSSGTSMDLTEHSPKETENTFETSLTKISNSDTEFMSRHFAHSDESASYFTHYFTGSTTETLTSDSESVGVLESSRKQTVSKTGESVQETTAITELQYLTSSEHFVPTSSSSTETYSDQPIINFSETILIQTLPLTETVYDSSTRIQVHSMENTILESVSSEVKTVLTNPSVAETEIKTFHSISSTTSVSFAKSSVDNVESGDQLTNKIISQTLSTKSESSSVDGNYTVQQIYSFSKSMDSDKTFTGIQSSTFPLSYMPSSPLLESITIHSTFVSTRVETSYVMDETSQLSTIYFSTPFIEHSSSSSARSTFESMLFTLSISSSSTENFTTITKNTETQAESGQQMSTLRTPIDETTTISATATGATGYDKSSYSQRFSGHSGIYTKTVIYEETMTAEGSVTAAGSINSSLGTGLHGSETDMPHRSNTLLNVLTTTIMPSVTISESSYAEFSSAQSERIMDTILPTQTTYIQDPRIISTSSISSSYTSFETSFDLSSAFSNQTSAYDVHNTYESKIHISTSFIFPISLTENISPITSTRMWLLDVVFTSTAFYVATLNSHSYNSGSFIDSTHLTPSFTSNSMIIDTPPLQTTPTSKQHSFSTPNVLLITESTEILSLNSIMTMINVQTDTHLLTKEINITDLIAPSTHSLPTSYDVPGNSVSRGTLSKVNSLFTDHDLIFQPSTSLSIHSKASISNSMYNSAVSILPSYFSSNLLTNLALSTSHLSRYVTSGGQSLIYFKSIFDSTTPLFPYSTDEGLISQIKNTDWIHFLTKSVKYDTMVSISSYSPILPEQSLLKYPSNHVTLFDSSQASISLTDTTVILSNIHDTHAYSKSSSSSSKNILLSVTASNTEFSNIKSILTSFLKSLFPTVTATYNSLYSFTGNLLSTSFTHFSNVTHETSLIGYSSNSFFNKLPITSSPMHVSILNSQSVSSGTYFENTFLTTSFNLNSMTVDSPLFETSQTIQIYSTSLTTIESIEILSLSYKTTMVNVITDNLSRTNTINVMDSFSTLTHNISTSYAISTTSVSQRILSQSNEVSSLFTDHDLYIQPSTSLSVTSQASIFRSTDNSEISILPSYISSTISIIMVLSTTYLSTTVLSGYQSLISVSSIFDPTTLTFSNSTIEGLITFIPKVTNSSSIHFITKSINNETILSISSFTTILQEQSLFAYTSNHVSLVDSYQTHSILTDTRVISSNVHDSVTQLYSERSSTSSNNILPITASYTGFTNINSIKTSFSDSLFFKDTALYSSLWSSVGYVFSSSVTYLSNDPHETNLIGYLSTSSLNNLSIDAIVLSEQLISITQYSTFFNNGSSLLSSSLFQNLPVSQSDNISIVSSSGSFMDTSSTEISPFSSVTASPSTNIQHTTEYRPSDDKQSSSYDTTSLFLSAADTISLKIPPSSNIVKASPLSSHIASDVIFSSPSHITLRDSSSMMSWFISYTDTISHSLPLGSSEMPTLETMFSVSSTDASYLTYSIVSSTIFEITYEMSREPSPTLTLCDESLSSCQLYNTLFENVFATSKESVLTQPHVIYTPSVKVSETNVIQTTFLFHTSSSDSTATSTIDTFTATIVSNFPVQSDRQSTYSSMMHTTAVMSTIIESASLITDSKYTIQSIQSVQTVPVSSYVLVESSGSILSDTFRLSIISVSTGYSTTDFQYSASTFTRSHVTPAMDNTISIIEGTSAYSRPPTTFVHPTTAAYSDSIVTAEDSTFILSKDSTNPQSAPSTTSSLHNALTGTSVLPTTLSKIFSSQFPSMVPTSFTILPSFNVPTGIDTFTSLIPSDVSTPNVTSLKSSLSELSSSFTTPPSYFATIYIETSSSIFTSTSILTPTPTQVLPTTANASTASEETWVKTVLKVLLTVDVRDPTFKSKTERNLAVAYNQAFARKTLMAEGKFQPLLKRRRKRYTLVGDTAVHVHDISRKDGGTDVTAVYTVENKGGIVQPASAVDALSLLDSQELAIILGQVVASKAETYIPTVTPSTPSNDGIQVWLIGAIAGGAGAVLLIVCIAICVYCKCCARKHVADDDVEPELMSIEQETTNKNEAYGSRPLPPSPSKRPMAHQRSTFSLKKGRSYEEEIPKKISNQQAIEEEKLVQATSKSKRKSPESALTPSKSPSKLALPGRNKRRNSKNAIDPTETIEMASNSHSDTSNSINNNINGLFQSSFSKDAEEIKEHLKTEKDKNKRRNRKKYSDTNGTESTPSILGMSSTPLSNPKIGSGSGSKNESPSLLNTQRKDAPEGDNLHEARHRMHKLLDEAFALITPRSSFNENDRQHAQVKDTEKERDIDTLVASRPDDPSGDPGYINPAYASSYSEYLQIWSPYRAADQVALISMPNIAAPVVTKQGGSKMKQNKRPVSNLTFIKTKSSTVLDNTSKYTNDPGKPIRLRIKSERGSSERPIQMTNNYVGERQFSVSSLREDARLPQSSTSLSKTIKTSSAKRAESDKTETTIEMRKHRRPDRNLGDKDVVDILNDIKPEEKTDTLLKSLRDELAACKMESEGDINSKPIRRKGRKPTKPMTNIV